MLRSHVGSRNPSRNRAGRVREFRTRLLCRARTGGGACASISWATRQGGGGEEGVRCFHARTKYCAWLRASGSTSRHTAVCGDGNPPVRLRGGLLPRASIRHATSVSVFLMIEAYVFSGPAYVQACLLHSFSQSRLAFSYSTLFSICFYVSDEASLHRSRLFVLILSGSPRILATFPCSLDRRSRML